MQGVDIDQCKERQRNQCKECGGKGICEHGRRRSHCKECGGTGIYEHGRERRRCKECGGKGICEHGWQRNQCKECGGTGICEHGRQRNHCKECGGKGICEHGRKSVTSARSAAAPASASTAGSIDAARNVAAPASASMGESAATAGNATGRKCIYHDHIIGRLRAKLGAMHMQRCGVLLVPMCSHQTVMFDPLGYSEYLNAMYPSFFILPRLFCDCVWYLSPDHDGLAPWLGWRLGPWRFSYRLY